MIKFLEGNLLDSNCDIIAHQVNLQGVMGGGLARQIALKYNGIEVDYYGFSQRAKLGDVYFYTLSNKKLIANCFSQEENFDTNYKAVRKCFEQIKSYCKNDGLKTIGVPYNYGCGIANGDWKEVEIVFEEIFCDDTELQIWKLEM